MARNPKPIRKYLKRYSFKFSRKQHAELKELSDISGLHHYILFKRKPLEVPLWQWALWFEYSRDRVLRRTVLPDGSRASTVFLGIDHGWGFGKTTPILFETMIFSGKHDGAQWRYTNYDDAIRGHLAAVDLLFEV